jgi:hypothetical protein
MAEFNVNKTLLTESPFVSKTGFSINPPKNWIKTENYNSELQNKVLYRLDNKLLAIYKSDSTNCALAISELPEPDFGNIKTSLDEFKSHPKKDSLWISVQPSFFKYKTYEIIQIVYQNQEMILFKLFAHRMSELYELDYFLPKEKININIQSVESSIGSIN